MKYKRVIWIIIFFLIIIFSNLLVGLHQIKYETMTENKKITIQGDGTSKRAFLHVNDTVSAFECILEKGVIGEIYNIGCDENMEYSVIDVAKLLIQLIKPDDNWTEWVEYIVDRPYNDRRYYINNDKLKKIGWNIGVDFMSGIKQLVLPVLPKK